MYTDRAQAGQLLADALARRGYHRPVVLAAPRGGVPVGAEIARRLNGTFDVILVRKLRHPLQPELAIGAIGERGEPIFNAGAASVSPDERASEIKHQRNEIARRAAIYRAVRPAADVRARHVILVDDGVATGATMLAAIADARRGAARITIALPVAPPDTRDELARHADEVICLHTPHHFGAVGLFYKSFNEVTDDEVIQLLRAQPNNEDHNNNDNNNNNNNNNNNDNNNKQAPP